MRPPIYKPSGAALEYAEWGLNIYDSCPHGCTYCYARDMAKRFGKPWGNDVFVRPGLLEALEKQLSSKEWHNAGRLVHLCFSCDPFPKEYDNKYTLEVIKFIKSSGNHVQILTKGGHSARDCFCLLDNNDWFGVTWSGAEFIGNDEPNSASHQQRHENIVVAKLSYGIKTWVSCEPVVHAPSILSAINSFDTVDFWRIGKMNHRESNIDWNKFGHEVEALCQKLGRNYQIKKSLRKEMEK